MELQSSIERIGPVECRLTVEIPWSEISTRLESKMKDLRRRARLPGFRPGKIPPQVAEKMFGKGVREELAQDLVQESFQSAIAEHEATPLTQPVVDSGSVEKGKDFKYAARFEVPPEVEPKDYVGVPVRRRPTVVDETQVDGELKQIQEGLVELRPLPEGLERTQTEPGDVWTVDLEGTIGEQRIARKDVEVYIGEPERDVIPGLTAELARLALNEVGQTKTVRFTPPPERLTPELKGKEAQLSLGLRDVRLKHVPPLDDDLARDTGDAESLDELKEQIRERLRKADAEQAEQEARQRLIQALLERNEFEPAPSMISREVSAQIEQTKRQLAQQGLKLDALGTNERDMAQRIRPQAVFNVKAFLLLDAIGNAESIEVSDEDFDAEVAKMADENGQNVTRMRATMENSGQLAVIRAHMREDRIFDFLMEKAEVTEAPDPEPEPDPGQ